LKKRSKKLLSITGNIRASCLDQSLGAISKSFLLLFFKKEDLPSPARANSPAPGPSGP
jgi:hypothetical protein